MPNDRMMVTKAKVDRIGDAIREKRHESVQYTLDEMPEKIRTIEGGAEAEAITITENGVYNAPEGKAYTPVTVNVQSGADTLNGMIMFTCFVSQPFVTSIENLIGWEG